MVKKLSHLPVIVDPSHATRQVRGWSSRMALAAVAAGADGLIIEVHNDPANALCDGQQSIRPSVYGELVKELRAIAHAVGREL